MDQNPPRGDQVVTMPIESIFIRTRIRPLRVSVVDELAASIRELGLLYPISVKANRQGATLVAGAHRLAAVEQLGWNSVPCLLIETADTDVLTLIEIDENLTRGELSQAERAIHIAKRKEVYERRYPQTKHGAAPGKAGGGKVETKEPRVDSFVLDTASKSGHSKTSIMRDTTRSKHIPQIVDVIGTSLDKGEELDALAKLPPDIQAPIIARAKAGEKVTAKTVAKQVRRASREKDLAEATQAASEQLGSKLYNVIYADPPWAFEPYSKDTGMDRAADNHYPTMTADDICALEIPAAADCALFLWATRPMLPEALRVMAAWGFHYKTCFGWGKERLGTGYWNRDNLELLLVGTKGSVPAPAPGEQYAALILAANVRHSEKPLAFAEIIESHFPTASLLEMFARSPRAGWDVWGNQAKPQGGP